VSTLPSKSRADEITLGYLDDLSSIAAESGNDSLHAVQLAVDEANDKGGIGGRKIRLVVYDGKVDSQLSATYALRFAEDDNGLILIGGHPAVPAAAVIPVANEYRFPYFSLSAATDSFTNPSTAFHFRFGPSNSQDAAAVAELIAQQGFKRVAIINNSLPYGLDGASAVKNALASRAIQVVGNEVYDVNATDLSPQVVRVRDAKPDVIVIWPYPADGGRLLRTLHQLNVTVPRIVARIALYDTLRKIAGESGDGALVTNTVDTDRPEVQAFFKKFNARFGQRPPTMYIAMAHDAAKMAIEIISQPEVQSALSKGNIDASRKAIRDGAERIGTFSGLQGNAGASYHFGPNQHQGPPDRDWFVWLEVKDGGLMKADLSKFHPQR
jgi:branched-chain amino acid transport system substrate-binding protein